MDINNHQIASFNQAQLQQLRIHELFRGIDIAFVNLFDNLVSSSGTHLIAFRIAFNNLNSLLATISSKMLETDYKEINKLRKELIEIIKKDNFFEQYHAGNKNAIRPNPKIMIGFEEKMFDYRILIEKFIDKYGFGNPSKEDQSKAIVSN